MKKAGLTFIALVAFGGLVMAGTTDTDKPHKRCCKESHHKFALKDKKPMDPRKIDRSKKVDCSPQKKKLLEK